MNLDDLIAQIPMDQLAAQLGVTPAEAEQSVRAALPALVGGMAANAADPDGEASLAEALGQHYDEGYGGDSPFDLGSVDTDDGGRIVDHVFGDQRDAVVDQLAGQQQMGGLSGGMLMKLLPLLAPLLMKWLAGMFKGRVGSPAGAGAGGGSVDTSGSAGGTGYGGDLSTEFDKMGTDADAPSGNAWPAPSQSTRAGAPARPSADQDPSQASSDQGDDSSAGGGGLGDLLGTVLGGNGGGLGDLLGKVLGGGHR